MPLVDDTLELVRSSRFFDADWYRTRYPDVAFSGLSEVEHFVRVGARLGRDPGPDFDTDAYLARYRDVATRGDNPLAHYERHGCNERRDPIPLPQRIAAAGTGRTADVVVPVYNAWEYTRACLESLANCDTEFAVRVIVVNDGSDRTTTEWLRDFCSLHEEGEIRFHLIEHDSNEGYTRAVNTGMMAADAQFVVTLNSDTIVTPFWLDEMLSCFESDPTIGIVGPLSNAASWQSVPELRDRDGNFMINELSQGMTPAEMAAIVRQASRKAYPRQPFVNGFCFMIRREVLESIGYMDEAAFPFGYGEENDFCIRAQDAGYSLAIADNCYLYHAKSKSFGHQARLHLTSAGAEAIREKHGRKRYDQLLEQVARTPPLDTVRRRIVTQLDQISSATDRAWAGRVTTQKILFLLPVGGVGGGAHSIIQEVAEMRGIGITARIAVFKQDYSGFLRSYSDIPDVEDLFVIMHDDRLPEVAEDFDVVVATFYSSVPRLERILAEAPRILPAYYAQDYEPAFHDEDEQGYLDALDSYSRIPGMVIFAKTDWLCREIENRHAVKVHKVTPSIDSQIYRPAWGKPMFEASHIRIAAMVRPSTPRRGAAHTMEVLARLKQRFKERISVTVFGCEDAEFAAAGLRSDFEFTNLGVIRRHHVADLLRETDLFLDLSDYQAFGRTALEAMACGAGVAVPRMGGCSEFALDGLNAIFVVASDVSGCEAKLAELLEDQAALSRMRLQGLQTASKYSCREAALSILLLLGRKLADWRGHPSHG